MNKNTIAAKRQLSISECSLSLAKPKEMLGYRKDITKARLYQTKGIQKLKQAQFCKIRELKRKTLVLS